MSSVPPSGLSYETPAEGPLYEAVLQASEISLMKLPSISPPITEEPKDDYTTIAVLINVKIEHLTDPKECLGLFQEITCQMEDVT